MPTIFTMPELIIDKTQTISGIQKQFNSAFPFLKIEFFMQPPISGVGNAKNKMIIYDMKLIQFQNVNRHGLINVTSNMKVSELEDKFANDFGLFVQVFRKSGKVWLETTATDNWTLQQQNEEGASLEKQLKTERESADDHDIY